MNMPTPQGSLIPLDNCVIGPARVTFLVDLLQATNMWLSISVGMLSPLNAKCSY